MPSHAMMHEPVVWTATAAAEMSAVLAGLLDDITTPAVPHNWFTPSLPVPARCHSSSQIGLLPPAQASAQQEQQAQQAKQAQQAQQAQHAQHVSHTQHYRLSGSVTTHGMLQHGISDQASPSQTLQSQAADAQFSPCAHERQRPLQSQRLNSMPDAHHTARQWSMQQHLAAQYVPWQTSTESFRPSLFLPHDPQQAQASVSMVTQLPWSLPSPPVQSQTPGIWYRTHIAQPAYTYIAPDAAQSMVPDNVLVTQPGSSAHSPIQPGTGHSLLAAGSATLYQPAAQLQHTRILDSVVIAHLGTTWEPPQQPQHPYYPTNSPSSLLLQTAWPTLPGYETHVQANHTTVAQPQLPPCPYEGSHLVDKMSNMMYDQADNCLGSPQLPSQLQHVSSTLAAAMYQVPWPTDEASNLQARASAFSPATCPVTSSRLQQTHGLDCDMPHMLPIIPLQTQLHLRSAPAVDPCPSDNVHQHQKPSAKVPSADLGLQPTSCHQAELALLVLPQQATPEQSKKQQSAPPPETPATADKTSLKRKKGEVLLLITVIATRRLDAQLQQNQKFALSCLAVNMFEFTRLWGLQDLRLMAAWLL